jgi:hypothetical protein
MLQYEPEERISLEAAILHPWITKEPLEYDEEVKDIISKTKLSKRHSLMNKTIHSRTESKQSRSLWDKYFGEKKRESGKITY